MTIVGDYLVLYICPNCGEEYYFAVDSLPGGDEFCEYCDICDGKLYPQS